jgi:hypothetical protein
MASATDRIRTVAEGEEITFLLGPEREPWITHVLPACDNQIGGQWHCATHDVGFRNQLEKDSHIHEGEHLLVWICLEHGPEVP